MHQKSSHNFLIAEYITEQGYSEEFLDLVCRCLRFDPHERPSINKLIEHKFFYIKFKFEEYKVTIKELLKISFLWSK